MGILNVTPDSFSDGGRHDTLAAAVARAHAMIDEGADIIDIGGESTRPGAAPVAPDEERARVLPVLRALRDLPVPLSLDTSAPALMQAGARSGRVDPQRRARAAPPRRAGGRLRRGRLRRRASCTCRASRRRCSRRHATMTWSAEVTAWLAQRRDEVVRRRGRGRAHRARSGVRLRQDARAQPAAAGRTARHCRRWAGRYWSGCRASRRWASLPGARSRSAWPASLAAALVAVAQRRAYRAGARRGRDPRRAGGLAGLRDGTIGQGRMDQEEKA